jgi:hypothetical protein
MAARLPMIRTSERGDFKDCQWYWLHHWVYGLGSPRVPTWSWFGTAIHIALSVRYQPGKKRASVADVLSAFTEALDGEVRRLYTEGIEPDEEEIHDAEVLGKAMLIGYMQHYGRDQAWHVVHNEQPFQIYVPHPTKPRRYLALYCGTWDLVVWDLVDKCYRIVDHKTRRSFPQDWSFYDVNDQGGSYLWVAPEVLRHKGIFGPDDKLDGIVFNCLRKAMPDERPKDALGIYRNQPKKEHYVTALARYGAHTRMKIVDLEALAELHKVRVLGEPSLKQPGPLFYRHTSYREEVERVKQARHVMNEARQMSLVRRGVLAPTKNRSENCPRCQLFDMCQIDEKDPDEAQEYARAMLVHTNPYAEHERAMSRDGITL